jgi:lipoyl(octanoyl) transferase
MICHVHDLGAIAYQPAWDLQNKLAAEIARAERPNTLLLLEHPHTFNFGRRGQPENLLWNEQELAARGVTVHWVDRGGDVTYHGPGQLVGYPLIRLSGLDHVGYIRSLEKMLIQVLSRLGLVAVQVSGKTGVWVQADIASRSQRCKGRPAKIAAIGIKVDANGITRHGFALNVDPDMDYFNGIIPCGIADYPVISLADIFPNAPAMELVKQEVMQAFGGTFGLEILKTTI